MLAASAVDAMLKVKGYKDGSLYQRIKDAAAGHIITADMATWAHQVRLDANDQRHADESASIPNQLMKHKGRWISLWLWLKFCSCCRRV